VSFALRGKVYVVSRARRTRYTNEKDFRIHLDRPATEDRVFRVSGALRSICFMFGNALLILAEKKNSQNHLRRTTNQRYWLSHWTSCISTPPAPIVFSHPPRISCRSDLEETEKIKIRLSPMLRMGLSVATILFY